MIFFVVVQGEVNLSRLADVLDWGVHGEETVPEKEQEVKEGPEQACSEVACALGVFAGPGEEVEAQLDQVDDVVGFGVGGGGCHDHNGVDDSQGDGFLPLDWGILDTVGFEMPDEALVNTGVSL